MGPFPGQIWPREFLECSSHCSVFYCIFLSRTLILFHPGARLVWTHGYGLVPCCVMQPNVWGLSSPKWNILHSRGRLCTGYYFHNFVIFGPNCKRCIARVFRFFNGNLFYFFFGTLQFYSRKGKKSLKSAYFSTKIVGKMFYSKYVPNLIYGMGPIIN